MQALATFAIVVAIAAVLALPALVAILRKHPRWVAITLLTAGFGWTGIGYVAALWWARGSTERRRRRNKAHWVKALSSKIWSTWRAASGPLPTHISANDNASSPMRTATADFLPDVIATDPYEDWLELGEALPETDPVVEPAPKNKPLAA